ncbi:MAG TPA: protein kinase [Gemmataceae bacterium]|jgi:serine/threonine protein kinase
MVPSQRHAAVSELTRLLDGDLPEPEQIELLRHLETCPACQQQLQRLTADGKSSDALARYLKSGSAGSSQTLREAISKLRDLTTFALPTQDEIAASEQKVFDLLDPPTKPDQLGIFANYEILEELGRGGRGIVFKALDPALNRIVAIKVIAPQFAAFESARQRFVREARAAAAVCHEHVVTIYAVAEAKGLPYLVMQFIAGVSLQQYLEKRSPLPLEEILRIGIQTAQGLAAAHAQGLVHRDIKPANILLESGVGRVKITDFGLARNANDPSITQVGDIVGTPQYMAPEQARGEAVDFRTDLFSLGSVLYFMCTGQVPFQGHSSLSVLLKVCEEMPPPINEINPSVPKWLVEIVGRLQAKEPANRFQSATEVTRVLAEKLALLRKTRSRPRPPVESKAASPPRPVAPKEKPTPARSPQTPPAPSAEKLTLAHVQLALYRKKKRVWAKQLTGSQATLGRGQNCTIRIPSADVSRLHCRLRMEADGLVRVEDLESANGTFINGTQIHGPEIVRPGDRLSLGPVTFVVEYETTTKTQPRPDGGDVGEIVEKDDTELIKDASTPPKKALPPLGEKEELDEKSSILGEDEDIRLPDKGDLRDFLIELE